MPAFLILGIMGLRKAGLGLLLIPAMLILGFTLIFSLAVSEMVKPLYDLTITIGGLGPSLILSILFLILAALHLRKLKLDLGGA
jgi:ABC-type antimicrobial peptide transport system permease subunit